MDEVDYKILEILRRDARTTNSEIANKVNLTEGAVRNRIRHLIEDKIIRRFTIETIHDRVEAIVLMKVRPRATKEALKRIRKYANRLFETTGEYDVAAYLTAETLQEINVMVDKIRNAAEVVSTITLLKIAEDQSDS